MYFGAGTARTSVAHLPEVVVFVAVYNMVLGEMLLPIRRSLIVAREFFGSVTFENGNVKVFRVEMQNAYKILEGIINGAFFKVIAETPVA